MEKKLEVKDLKITFTTDNGLVQAVRNISFDLYEGETLCIVGESGSGKSVTSKAIMGILPNNAIVESGSIIYEGENLLDVSEEEFHKIRGHKIGMIFQDPLSSLNPIVRIGKQITEATLVNSNKIKQKYENLISKELMAYKNQIARIKIKNDKAKSKHDLLVKELNKKIKNSNEIYQELISKELTDYKNMIAYYSTLNSKAKSMYYRNIAQRKSELNEKLTLLKIALDDKKISLQEQKEQAKIINDEYKKDIAKLNKDYKEIIESNKNKLDEELVPLKAALDAKKVSAKEQINKDNEEYKKEIEKSVIEYKEIISKNKAELSEKLPPLKAALEAKEKSAKAEVKEYVSSIKAELSNSLANINQKYDLKNKKASLTKAEYSNLVKDYKKEILAAKKEYIDKTKITKAEAKARALEIMKEVGIPMPEKRFKQYPFEFSGGMRQRIVIAIALTATPDVLICDEPTTALDVTIQAQILELINKLKRERNLSCIFITHDLGVVANMADRVAVMYAGKIVEYGKVDEIFFEPKHPYTWALLSSIPDVDSKERLDAIPGTPPDMIYPPKGDAFALRSKYALEIDFKQQPPFFKVSDTHYAATWLLHPNAPKVEMPKIVSERIKNALTNQEKEESSNE